MGQRRDICDRRRTYDELTATGWNFGRGFCNIKFTVANSAARNFTPQNFAAANFAMKNLTG